MDLAELAESDPLFDRDDSQKQINEADSTPNRELSNTPLIDLIGRLGGKIPATWCIRCEMG